MTSPDKITDNKTPAHCGSKPKRLAIGIVPFGTISIGIVPMGVVCIGVVPMGVVSIGVVAMGVINASVVGMGLLCVGVTTMGVWTAGPLSMGLVDLAGSKAENSHQHHLPVSKNLSKEVDPRFMAYATREEAEAKAKELSCNGAHQMGSYWMPCEQHSQH
ncbi:MAG: hypothetical protein AB8A40_01635 [Prochlorococcus sp.]|jgi:hypothetical protein|nr:hypothetical protein [Prochlorococcaceae cyanobacterium Fu_MAG_134]